MKSLLYLLVCLQLFVLVNCSTIYVSEVDGITNINCGVSEITPCVTLRLAIEQAEDNDIILLAPGNYTDEELCSTSAPCTFTNVTISGQSNDASKVIIESSGGNSTRFLSVYGDTITKIENITVKNFVSTLDLGNIKTLSFDSLESSSGAALLIVNSTRMVIDNVIFYNNTASSGGAIGLASSSIHIYNSVFNLNHAQFRGGAMIAVNTNLFIYSSNFNENSAKASSSIVEIDGHGGAVYYLGGINDIFKVDDTEFNNNAAVESAGAIYVYSLSPELYSFQLNYVTLHNNSVSGLGECATTASCYIRGGAIFMNLASSYFSNVHFTDNTVTAATNEIAEGGAVYSMVNINVDIRLGITEGNIIEDCTFIKNSAQGYGGAYYSNNQDLLLSNCTFKFNTAGSEDLLFDDALSSGGAVWFTGSSSIGTITSCNMYGNYVWGGQGGAIFVTSAAETFDVYDSIFDSNYAISSYTNTGQGGAVMISGDTNANFTLCDFKNNSALPHPNSSPRMLSGAGGAMYVQSSTVNITNCSFVDNVALTGQFDSGSLGGAILFEHVSKAYITFTGFTSNGAAGYLGFSTYASSGTGGAIMLKFSVVMIDNCYFNYNWVTVGGTQMSAGAAIAIFSTYSDSKYPTTISNTHFSKNYALSDVCQLSGPKAGQGGAIAIAGAADPGVLLISNVFDRNIAVSIKDNGIPALGGAISVALESFVALYSCHFIKNVAYNGIGNDFTVLPIVGSAVGSNITIDSVIFDLANSTYVESLDVDVLSIDSEVCAIVTRFDKLNPSGITRSRKLLDNTRQFVTDVDIREQQIKDELMRFDDKTLTQVVWSKYKQELIAELEHISMLKYDDNIRDKSTSWSKRRKLGLLSKLNFLLQPSIVIGAGVAKFVSPIFNENYNIFIGNFLELLSIQSFYGYVTPSCSVSIGGNIEQEGLTLVSYKADVYLKRFGLASLNIEALHLINSTLYASNNITISGNSTISSSAIKSITTDLSLADYVNISNPEVNFLGNVYTGLGFQDSIGIFGFGDDDSIDSTWFPPNILFDACTVTIYKKLQITSPSFEKKSFDIKSTITLKNNALLNISSTGELGITVGTKIQADRSDLIALSNYGTVKLLGYAVSTSPFISDGSKSIVSLTDLESVYSPLTVDGIFTQSSHGKLIITIGNISSNHPSLNLYSNESLLGTIYVNINSNSDVKLYGTATPTEWQFAKYEVTKVNPIGSANIVGTNGLGYKIGYEYNATNSYKLTENLIIESISCDQLQYYYNSQSLCGYCSLNSSCSYCNNDKCVDNGQCSTVGSTSKSSCCGDSCTDEHGTCHMSSSFDYSCECTFFYSGNTCNNLSVGALGIIIASVFIFTFTVITFYYKMYYKGQKTLVLEELRQGLLQSEDGMYSSQDNTYIQSLQQELILKDVFVNYKEIKLEYKIGEGSFGVVYKAVFRGAQVAVKKMRSPLFMELTQNDIEEFRKEAYMMSRLRHPNIVLVMGISLVDQDPVKLPTTSVDGLASPMNKNNKDVKMKKIVCIITEYLEKGSLADILYGPSRLPPDVLTYERILTCAHQAARGMLYLHSLSPPIMHRDLKSSNLVVDDHWVVKVTDFGMSRIVPEKLQDLDKGLAPSEHGDDDLSKVEELSDYYFERDSLAKPPSETSFHNLENSTFNLEMTSNLGTTAWCAPELLTVSNTTKYSLKVDVYSFGMVLWELWEKKRPFDDLHSRFDIMDAIRSGKRPPISSTCPPAYRSLMERCWDPQPAKRPIFKYIEKYLKDELARVKRTNASVAIPGNFISSSLTEWNLSMSSPSAAGSATGGNVITNFLQSWGTRSRSNTMQSEQGPETQNPITSSGDKSPLRQNIMSESYTSDQAPSPKMQSGGQPNIKPNKWRDQYVMKFSGWNASQPDVGLPPTLASTSGNGFGSTVVSIPPRTTSIGSSVTNTGNDNVQNQVRRSVRERDGNSNNIIIEDNGIFSLDSDEGDSSPLENQRDFMMHNAVSVNNNNDNNNIGSNRSSKSTTIGKTE